MLFKGREGRRVNEFDISVACSKVGSNDMSPTVLVQLTRDRKYLTPRSPRTSDASFESDVANIPGVFVHHTRWLTQEPLAKSLFRSSWVPREACKVPRAIPAMQVNGESRGSQFARWKKTVTQASCMRLLSCLSLLARWRLARRSEFGSSLNYWFPMTAKWRALTRLITTVCWLIANNESSHLENSGSS